jgi:hypothetical protein
MSEGGELKSPMSEGGELKSPMSEGGEHLVVLIITLFGSCKFQ